MKKQKPKKIRKVWGIKPHSRIQKSSKRDVMDKVKKRDARQDLE